jgi:hypothetical protein
MSEEELITHLEEYVARAYRIQEAIALGDNFFAEGIAEGLVIDMTDDLKQLRER